MANVMHSFLVHAIADRFCFLRFPPSKTYIFPRDFVLHTGASTEEAQVNVARDIAQQMCDVFDQKEYYGVVNVSYMSATSFPPMKAFMRLCEIIGGGGFIHCVCM